MGRKRTNRRRMRPGSPSKLPLWLRRLDRVKAKLKGTRFPSTAERVAAFKNYLS
jgi:hypothetical protein